ncbi:MAG: glycoside hydrolase family 16 protein [Candidatus Thorarchaeota archaeon]
MNIDRLQTGSFPPNPVDKPGYCLVFHDDFRDKSLDRDKWLPFYLPQWSNRRLAAARYSLGSTGLSLFIEHDQQPWCPEHDGAVRVSSLQSGCFSGPLGSPIGQHRFNPRLLVKESQPTTRLYTPQYGYFETRLKAIPIPGYMVAFWMIGLEEHPQQSAEICICEIFGSQIAEGGSTVGVGVHPFNDPALTDEFHYDTLDFNAANYHIYAAEWMPYQVEFFIDNLSVRTVRQSPSYPMQFMLGIYEIPEHLNAQSLNNLWPKTLEVDYVRGYQPTTGYAMN